MSAKVIPLKSKAPDFQAIVGNILEEEVTISPIPYAMAGTYALRFAFTDKFSVTITADEKHMMNPVYVKLMVHEVYTIRKQHLSLVKLEENA